MPSHLPSRLLLTCVALLLPPAATLAAPPQRIVLEPSTSAQLPFRASAPLRWGNGLVFLNDDPLYGRELWESDGSAEGSRPLIDLCPGSCSSSPELILMGDRLFLVEDDALGQALYEMAGDQPSLVARFTGHPRKIVASSAELFIDLVDYSHYPYAERLYRTDGEPGDLRLVETICEDQGVSSCDSSGIETYQNAAYYLKDGFLRRLLPGQEPENLFPLLTSFRIAAPLAGSRFLFFACSGQECGTYASDGSIAGTFLVQSGAARGFTPFDGKVFWVNGDGRLVRSDGTPAGTVVLPVVVRRLIGATPTHLFFTQAGATAGDIRLFARSAGGTDVELLAFADKDPESLGVLGNSIFLTKEGKSLHVSNGTPAGTRLLADLSAKAGDAPAAVLGNRLFAPVERISAPQQLSALWSFDAAGNGQRFERTVAAGDYGKPYALGDGTLFAASGPDPIRQWQVWRVDKQTFAASPVGVSPLRPKAASGDRLLAESVEHPYTFYGVTPAGVELLPIRDDGRFAASSDGKFYWGKANPGQVLWETDGTAAGTRQLHDFSPGWTQNPGCNRHCAPEYPSFLRVVGDDVYLVAEALPGDDPLIDGAVWVYHRSSGQVVQLKAFDDADSLYAESVVFFPVGNKVVFELQAPAADSGLWVTDGTPAGTRKFIDRTSEFLDRFHLLAALRGQLIFASRNDSSRLWVSDLTTAGTRLLVSGPDFAFDGEMVVAGGRLFFAATTAELGRELWTSDGTAAGTRPLDLRPGPLGSNPSALVAAGNRVVFAADRGTDGHELYLSDGKLEGTILLADLAPGKDPSSPSGLIATGDRVFFSADDGAGDPLDGGRGLWVLDLPAPSPSTCPDDRLRPRRARRCP